VVVRFHCIPFWWCAQSSTIYANVESEKQVDHLSVETLCGTMDLNISTWLFAVPLHLPMGGMRSVSLLALMFSAFSALKSAFTAR
jgi:hypothetical protein